MRHSVLVAVLLAFAAGCASAPVVQKVATSSSGRSTSEELECMSECLDSADEDCESCVAQCLKPTADALPPVAFK